MGQRTATKADSATASARQPDRVTSTVAYLRPSPGTARMKATRPTCRTDFLGAVTLRRDRSVAAATPASPVIRVRRTKPTKPTTPETEPATGTRTLKPKT